MIIGSLVEIAGNIYKVVSGVNKASGTVSFYNLLNNMYLRHYKGYCRNDCIEELNTDTSKKDASFYPIYVTKNIYIFKCSNYDSRFISKYLGISANNELQCKIFTIPKIGEKVRCNGEIFTVVQPLNGDDNCVSLYNDKTNVILKTENEVNFIFIIYKQEIFIVPYNLKNELFTQTKPTTDTNLLEALYNDNTKAFLEPKLINISNLYLSIISENNVNCLLKIERIIGYIDSSYFEDYLSNIEKSLSKCLTLVANCNNVTDRLSKMFTYNFPASNVPSATGFMRRFQMLGVDLLRLIDQICRTNQLSYWLCAGSLIGAVRHQGFVPWDDDIDICMTITDFYKLRKLLNGDKKYSIYANDWIYIDDFEPYSYTIHNTNNNSWIDIFVYYYMPDDVSNKEHSNLVKNIKTTGQTIREKEGIEAYRKYISDELDKVSSKIVTKRLFSGLQSWDKFYLVYETDLIFPLKELRFEGFDVYVPNKYEKILLKTKGDFYDYPLNLAPAHITSLDKIVYKHDK